MARRRSGSDPVGAIRQRGPLYEPFFGRRRRPPPKGAEGQVYVVAPVCFFFQAKRRVGIKRRAMSFGIVVGMDENSMRFLADGDPTIGSGITGHQSSEFNRQKRLFFSRVA